MAISAALRKLAEAKNPEYAIRNVVNLAPFKTEAEMLGRSAGRIYLRGQNTIHAATMSDNTMRELRDQITRALRQSARMHKADAKWWENSPLNVQKGVK